MNKPLKKIVENNYDLLMMTSSEVTFEFDSEMIVGSVFKKQGIELVMCTDITKASSREFLDNQLVKVFY